MQHKQNKAHVEQRETIGAKYKNAKMYSPFTHREWIETGTKCQYSEGSNSE